MALGRKNRSKQKSIWIPSQDVARSPGHPFYKKLNEVLRENDFDTFGENLCAPYFREGGRPSIPPGVYFRMLLIGYFEGLGSERAIAWRCQDSLSLREFLGYDVTEDTPDHSTLSVWRHRLDEEVFQKVFDWVLGLVNAHGLVDGKTLGVDSTTLEANAAMKSIVRKDTEESYDAYIGRLAREAGESHATREERIRFDRKRKDKKLSNREWESATDPDARIAKMKNGSTRMAYKAENAVDLESAVIVAGRITPADEGDTKTIRGTLDAAKESLKTVSQDKRPTGVVADKGYHNTDLIFELNRKQKITTYFPERNPEQWRFWNGDKEACRAFHANRARCRRSYGKALGRKRANLVERTFAHLLETAGLRRMHLRGFVNVQKRYLAHVLAYNLGVLMRMLFGFGTPRSLQGWRLLALFYAYCLTVLAYWVQNATKDETNS
jgi:transposase